MGTTISVAPSSTAAPSSSTGSNAPGTMASSRTARSKSFASTKSQQEEEDITVTEIIATRRFQRGSIVSSGTGTQSGSVVAKDRGGSVVSAGYKHGVDFYESLKSTKNEVPETEVVFAGGRRNKLAPWGDRQDGRGHYGVAKQNSKKHMHAHIHAESFNFLVDQAMTYLKIDANWMKTNFRRFLLPAMSATRLIPDMVLFREGDKGTFAFVVEEGLLRAVDADGVVICELKSGAVFGANSLLYDHHREFSVICVEHTKLWSIGREAYGIVQRAVHSPSLSVNAKLLFDVLEVRALVCVRVVCCRVFLASSRDVPGNRSGRLS